MKLFSVTADGRILNKSGKVVRQVQPFAMKAGKGEVRDGRIVLNDVTQNPSIRGLSASMLTTSHVGVNPLAWAKQEKLKAVNTGLQGSLEKLNREQMLQKIGVVRTVIRECMTDNKIRLTPESLVIAKAILTETANVNTAGQQQIRQQLSTVVDRFGRIEVA